MNVKTALNDELLAQDFAGEVNLNRYLTHYKQVASMYAEVENSIAVLSDMGSNRSYIYYGKVGEFLGIALHGECHLIESIWEEEIFSRIHPDDLVKKHTRELRFLHFLKNALEKQRSDYYLEEYLRMCDSMGKYHQVLHRMFYVIAQDTGNICLALCLYNLTEVSSIGSIIVNSADGSRIDIDTYDCSDLLSKREKEILILIGRGKSSKEIAEELSLSIHTVSRHRQNILQKLQVSNSAQAFGIARELHLL